MLREAELDTLLSSSRGMATTAVEKAKAKMAKKLRVETILLFVGFVEDLEVS